MKLKLVSAVMCPYGQRAVILLREKNAAHEVTYIDLEAKPDWFLKISPRGKVPVLLADDVPLFESSAICEFLDETCPPPRLMPEDPVARAHSADTQPEDLRPIPGSTLAQGLARKERRQQGPPRITPEEAKEMAEKAISDRRWLQMEYLSTKDQSRKEFIVVPERVALNREGALVLVATEITANQRLSFALAQILRLRSVEGKL